MASKQANAKLALRITGGVFRFALNILFYIIVVMCTITFSKAAYEFSYQVFGDVTVDEEQGREVKIRIESGESTMAIARKLEQNKIIVNKNTFYLKAKLEKVGIMPGTYVVSSTMTYDEIFDILSDVSNSLTQDEYMDSDDSSDSEAESESESDDSETSDDSNEESEESSK